MAQGSRRQAPISGGDAGTSLSVASLGRVGRHHSDRIVRGRCGAAGSFRHALSGGAEKVPPRVGKASHLFCVLPRNQFFCNFKQAICKISEI